ncbi:hypothetical protein [Falsihalocynthiibacter sp. CO-5D18]|uniref:hypothetical protein n=1 Tax=Falsihalocynthiibacter sp. CO-5D18 TaxID=3240872 RepID=UPI0035106A27
MQMKTFIKKFGLSRADVENWIARPSVQLRTKYAPTTKGRAREFTRKNVMELALVGALVKAGVKPSEVAMWAEVAIEDYCIGLPSIELMAFPPYSFGQMVTANKYKDLDIPALLSQFGGAIILVEVGKYLREVDDLFSSHYEAK